MTDQGSLTLYRRYRPMQFRQLVGQENVAESLRISVEEGTTGHAYLFYGERGCGKTSAAGILARAVNCYEPQNGEPCNKCDSCTNILNGTSLTVQNYDAATYSGVNEVRDIIKDVGNVTDGKKKVIIIDEAHLLSPQAEAALLITTEEPPPNVIFILCSTDERSIGSALKSRFQKRPFNLIPSDKVAWWLGKVSEHAGLNATPEQINDAVLYGRGSARESISGLEAILSGVKLSETSAYKILESLPSKDTLKVLSSVSQAIREGNAPRGIAEALFTLLRECFFVTMGAEEEISTPDWGQRSQIAQAMGPKNITNAISQLGEAITGMQSGGDARVHLEIALARYCAMAK